MLTSKRFTGDYKIESIDNGTITIGASGDDVIVEGELTVNGTLTTVNTTDLAITDNNITLNNGEAGTGVSPGGTGTAGITVDRGLAPNDATFTFDDTDDTWKIDTGTGTSYAILSTAPGSPGLLNVVEDTTPQLGGDLDVNLNSIIATTNNDIPLTVTGSGDIILTTASTGRLRFDAPAIVSGPAPTGAAIAAGDVALYQAADSGGGTQVHFQNDTETGELVSKTKALVYGLIL